MFARNLDEHNRFRCITVGFRVSPEEHEHINVAVALSGLSKQEYCYGTENAASITTGSAFDAAQTLHPAFMLLTPESSCPQSVSHRVYESVQQARVEQQYRTIPLDIVHDFRVIDSIISNDASGFIF